MKLKGSSLRSQEHATCPHPEPNRSSLCPPPLIQPLKDPVWYYPPIYTWVLQVVSFPQVSPLKPCMHFSFPSYMLHVLPTLVFTWSLEWYLVRCTEHKAPSYEHLTCHYNTAGLSLLLIISFHTYTYFYTAFSNQLLSKCCVCVI
jgi:hypothetical protein